jgi:hypothetical protein
VCRKPKKDSDQHEIGLKITLYKYIIMELAEANTFIGPGPVGNKIIDHSGPNKQKYPKHRQLKRLYRIAIISQRISQF